MPDPTLNSGHDHLLAERDRLQMQQDDEAATLFPNYRLLARLQDDIDQLSREIHALDAA